MSNKIIYVVQGTTGEYSDRTEWLVKAFSSEEEAKNYILHLTQLVKLYEMKIKEDEDNGIYPWDAKEANKDNEIYKCDKNFAMDYTGTRYFYNEVELEEKVGK